MGLTITHSGDIIRDNMKDKDLGLRWVPVEALIQLDPEDPRRREIERLAHLAASDGTIPTEAPTKEAEIESRLQQAAYEFNTQPHTPELVTKIFQKIWQARGEIVGATYEVTKCPYTQEKLEDLEASGKRLGYLPAQLATQQTRHILGEMFPKMQSGSVQKGNSVTNDENPSDWFDYEAAIDAPYLDTKERQLIDRIKKDGRQILSLNQYIVAREDSKLFTGQYLDEGGTFVRLGSRGGGVLVYAYSYRDGCLCVDWYLGADHHSPRLGGRSS